MDISQIVTAVWFFLPAGLANMAPVFAAKLPWIKNLDYPLDCYVSWRGARVFGSHKTWRGLISGIIVAMATVLIQQQLYSSSESLREIVTINYSDLSFWLLGGLLGVGAIIGDAIESFFKRLQHISSGQSWLVFDQIDYILGGLIFSAIYLRLEPVQYLIILIIFFGLHFIVTSIGYLVGLKEKPI